MRGFLIRTCRPVVWQRTIFLTLGDCNSMNKTFLSINLRRLLFVATLFAILLSSSFNSDAESSSKGFSKTLPLFLSKAKSSDHTDNEQIKWAHEKSDLFKGIYRDRTALDRAP